MPFMFVGSPIGVKSYKRKDGSPGAMVQFVDVGDDGAASFYEFSVPQGINPNIFQVGTEVSFPVQVGGKEAYYRIAGDVRETVSK